MSGMIGVKFVGVDRFYRLVDELRDIDKNKAIKAGLRRGANDFIQVGRRNLRTRNQEKTGNLFKSMMVRVKKRKLGALAGFSMDFSAMDKKGYGSHSWLVDRGTNERYTKTGASRGKMPASYFWSDAKRDGTPQAMREIENGIISAVERIKARY